MSSTPPVVTFRCFVRGRLVYATPGWLLEESPTHAVIAVVPGAETLQLVAPRAHVLRELAQDREQTGVRRWHTNRVVWLMPFGVAHAIGHFWNDATGEFLGHYVNLQAPLRRTPLGFDSGDHVLDIVVAPDGAWRWKDEDEFAEAILLNLFTPAQAAEIRAEGERVIARLPAVLPTGWETWQPDPTWPVSALKLPPDLRV